MHTRIKERFGIRRPIIQGGMHCVGLAGLAAAVSNAGGLGLITGLTQGTPEKLDAEIARCRELTDQPFGVNLTFLHFECGGHPGEDDVPNMILLPWAADPLKIPFVACL